jgi:hypothetical protein
VRRILGAILLLLAARSAAAATYAVGPGQPYASIGAVPWHTLAAGDLVLIHWRATPYREKWVICRQGTAAAPIVVRGVPGPGGELPVIDGDGATTPAPLNYWNEERSVVKIGGANVPADTVPEHITIENLDIGNARPPLQYTGDDGAAHGYIANAAAIHVEKGRHITVRNCILRAAGNGLFVGTSGGITEDVLVEGCYIHGNGNAGSAFEHNTYTEATRITYQLNRFGPPCTGCSGNNLKDRSAGTVVRYNWIEGGNRQLDLVDSDTLHTRPEYGTTLVYGNVLIEPDGAGNSQIVHYGGDSGDEDVYRKGTLHLYNNTIVSTRSGNTTLLRLSTNDEHADARNNVVWVTAPGSALAMLATAGVLDLRNNWLKTGWQTSHDGAFAGAVNDLGANVTGASPGFVNPAAQDFHLAAGSAAVDAGGALAAGALPVLSEYVKHQHATARAVAGALDIGAFELAAVGPPPAAPSGLAATTVSAVRIDLAWTDESDDETGFDVERSADGGTVWDVVGNVGADVVAFEDGGLAAATTYGYRVRATNGSGASAPSNVAVATTDAGNPPLCTSGIPIERPSLKLRASPFSLALKGEAVIPKPWTAVDPAAHGLHVRVDGVVGAGSIDAVLPAGAGWSVNRTGTRWTWRDTAGTHAGVTKVTLSDMSRVRDGLLRFNVRGKGGAAVLPSPAEVRTGVVFGAPDECAVLVWGGPDDPRPQCEGDAGALRCR